MECSVVMKDFGVGEAGGEKGERERKREREREREGREEKSDMDY